MERINSIRRRWIFGSEENRTEWFSIHNRRAQRWPWFDKISTFDRLLETGISTRRVRQRGVTNMRTWIVNEFVVLVQCAPLSAATIWRRQQQPDASHPSEVCSGCQTALIESNEIDVVCSDSEGVRSKLHVKNVISSSIMLIVCVHLILWLETTTLSMVMKITK